MDLNALLARTIERGGSDLHLKVASPPMARIDGQLTAVDDAALTDDDLEAALQLVSARTPAERDHFYTSGDLDTAYIADGAGRFRVNAFRQRGAISFAFRHVPKEVPSFDRLGTPGRRAEARRGAPRPRPRHRRDGLPVTISNLTSIIEPLMMILVGMMVGVVIIAMYLSMFKMMSLLGAQ